MKDQAKQTVGNVVEAKAVEPVKAPEPAAQPEPKADAPKRKLTTEQVVSLLRDAGIRMYQTRSGFPLSQAQRNLEGRTLYAEDNQLKVRNAAIVSADVLADGLLFGVVESFRMLPMADMQYRPVIFDLFGNIVHTIPEDKCPTSLSKANGMFWMVVDDLNGVQLNVQGVHQRKAVLQAQIDELDKLAEDLQR